jgi:hypothetical protein
MGKEDNTHLRDGSRAKVEKHLHGGLRFEFVDEFLVNHWNAVSTSLVEEYAQSYSQSIWI